MLIESPVGVVAKEKTNDAGRGCQQARLHGEIVVWHIALGSRVGHQETGNGNHQQLGAKLLLDAEDGFGVQLPEGEEVALQQLVDSSISQRR